MLKSSSEETEMEIYLAEEMGFCWGVRRAINIAEKALKEWRVLKGLGPIVHNEEVVSWLAAQGLEIVESPEEVEEGPTFIPAHGIGLEMLRGLEEKRVKVIDATCPIVRRAQKVAQKLNQNGFQVLVFGEAQHSEIKGIISWAGGKALAALEVPHFSSPPRRLGVLSQTTQSSKNFSRFVRKLLSLSLASLSELRIFNTICDATSKRQEAALELAERVDQMIVIGSYDSANTNRLTEICSSIVPTLHTESADELGRAKLRVERIGITAGASTPDWVIQKVVERLRNFEG